MEDIVKKFKSDKAIAEIFSRYRGDFLFIWSMVIPNFLEQGIENFKYMTDEEIEAEVEKYAKAHPENKTNEEGHTVINLISDYNVRDMLVICRVVSNYDYMEIVDLLSHRWDWSELVY